jgi:hypothetical protein
VARGNLHQSQQGVSVPRRAKCRQLKQSLHLLVDPLPKVVTPDHQVVDHACLTLVVPHELAQCKQDQSSPDAVQDAVQVAQLATKMMISVAPRLKVVKQFVNY